MLTVSLVRVNVEVKTQGFPSGSNAFRRAGPSVLGDFELGSDEEFRSGRPMLRGAGGGRAGSGAAQGAIATEVERSDKA